MSTQPTSHNREPGEGSVKTDRPAITWKEAPYLVLASSNEVIVRDSRDNSTLCVLTLACAEDTAERLTAIAAEGRRRASL